jgi:hypothetical protein
MLCWCKVEAVTVDLNIIKQIESGGNPLAYNRKSGAKGLYQITPICLKDYNRKNKPPVAPSSLFNPANNEKVAKWYITQQIPLLAQKKGIPMTLDNLLIAYNWGIGNLERFLQGKAHLPKETANYIKHYNKLKGKYAYKNNR